MQDCPSGARIDQRAFPQPDERQRSGPVKGMPLLSAVGGMQSTPDIFSGSSIGGWLAPASPSATLVEGSRVCLDGSLDDLPIQDVLQILALGRKTGCLALETGIGVGALLFRQGQVVASIHDGDGGPLPAADGVTSSEAEREALIRERIAAFLHRLARRRQGEFSFVAYPHPPPVIHGRDVTREALRQGRCHRPPPADRLPGGGDSP
jgi:hypothetical protein